MMTRRMDMGEAPENSADLPPNLRFLKALVTVLTATMILGLLAMVAIFVIRLRPAPPPVLPLPDEIALPAGEVAQSVSWGSDFYVVVTESRKVLVFDLQGSEIGAIDLK